MAVWNKFVYSTKIFRVCDTKNSREEICGDLQAKIANEKGIPFGIKDKFSLSVPL